MIALHALQSKYYDLQTIQKWKGVENEKKWERLNIKPGIGIRLARDLKSWAKTDSIATRISKSVSSHSPPPVNQQQPPRISQVMKKLEEKSRLAAMEERHTPDNTQELV